MYIGECCFTDPEIIERISSHKKRGCCEVTGVKDTCVYDTDSDDYLQGIFNKLIKIYVPAKTYPKPITADKKVFIKDDVPKKWNIFKNIDSTQIYKILFTLSSELYNEEPFLFDEPVVDSSFDDEKFVNENSILKNADWSNFVNTLKHKNRFHTNCVNIENLNKICTYIRKPYKKGNKFFRGRIINDVGYTADNMGAPPPDKATAGRANSAGISRLYLATNKQTALHELRAGAFDSITVGEFELLKDITVVDLKMLDKISPFIEELDPRLLLINRECLNKINEEICKPLRKNDSTLDYLPTQYIVDLIQSFMNEGESEYNGVEYKSTLNSDGVNLAIFDTTLFCCKSVQDYEVKELIYKVNPEF